MSNLSPGEIERLAMLAEEANEVAQIAMKTIRFGYDSVDPRDGITNTTKLISELQDLLAVVGLLNAMKELPSIVISDEEMTEKVERKISYMRNKR